MKRIITFFILSILVNTINADKVTLTIDSRTWNASYGSDNIRLIAENNISNLLSAINNAAEKNTDISYNGIDITSNAINSINGVWNRLSHFSTESNEMNENCMKVGVNFQLRGIGIILEKADHNGNTYRDVVVTFSKKGTIEGLMLQPLEFSQDAFMKDVAEDDIDQRFQMLHYVERFRSFYESKDLASLQKIFSDDALIITGEVVKKTKNRIKERNELKLISDKVDYENKVIYRVKSKKEYLANLSVLFKTKESIKLVFSDIEVFRHRAKGHLYAVNLRQKWESKDKNGRKYMDDGKLFLLWDFSDPESPVINVRKWTHIDDVTTFDDFVLDDM